MDKIPPNGAKWYGKVGMEIFSFQVTGKCILFIVNYLIQAKKLLFLLLASTILSCQSNLHRNLIFFRISSEFI